MVAHVTFRPSNVACEEIARPRATCELGIDEVGSDPAFRCNEPPLTALPG